MFVQSRVVFYSVIVGVLLFVISGCETQKQKISRRSIEADRLEKSAEETEISESLTPELKEEKRPLPAQKTAELYLNFEPGTERTCRVKTLSTQEVKWEGNVPDSKQFKGGKNMTELDMTFTQRIESVDDSGVAVAKITIDRLKFHAVRKGRVVMDFNSVQERDALNALSRLIGKSYKLSISPKGDVLKVFGAEKIKKTARQGRLASVKFAKDLLEDSTVKRRHGIVKLPSAEECRLERGQQWSDNRSFDFGMMGSDFYERVYTLEEIKKNGTQIALASMEALPSTETSAELSQEQQPQALDEMFDNKVDYTGTLRFDLASKKIDSYSEKLDVEWFTIMPNSGEESGDPIVLRMKAARHYSLETLE